MASDTPEREQFLDLVVRYVEGDLDAAEVRTLDEVLRTDAARRADFVDYCLQAQLLREFGGAFLEHEAPATPSEAAPSSLAGRTRAESISTRRLTGRPVAALCTVAVLAFCAIWILTIAFTPSAALSVRRLDGTVSVVRDGRRMPLTNERRALRERDLIHVEEASGHAVVEYSGGTQVSLVGVTSLGIDDDGQQLLITEGTVRAVVAPQETDRPLILRTSQADVEVLGTILSIARYDDRTEVSVDEGRVRVAPVTGGKTIELAEGEFAIARQGAELIARAMPRPPDAWSVDFEPGRPRDWRTGQHETSALPGTSIGALRAERVENEHGVFHEIRSAKRWSEGLFSIHADSHLRFTFKLERPDWFQIFIATRPFDPEAPPTLLYRFKDPNLSKWSQRGRWFRATIPLAAFERVPERRGTPPLGEVPFELLFSSKGDDRGLVIDEMSVGRGGPGRVVLEEIK